MIENNDNNAQHLNPLAIERLLTIQEQELVIRGKELEIQKQTLDNAHIYSIKALEGTKEDLEAARKHEEKIIKHRYIYSGLVLIGLMILIGFALHLNKDKIVMEIIKGILLFGSGGLSGYALGKIKKEPEQT